MAIEQLFAQIREEIPGVIGAATGSFDGSSYQAQGWGSLDIPGARAPLCAMVKGWHDTYQTLGSVVDFGSNDEVLISASKGYLLVKANHDKSKFVAVFLAASGNIGYLRFRMREYLRVAVSA